MLFSIDPTLIRLFIGVSAIGLSAALVGTFLFLRKQSLIGDALSHSVLPGVVLSYVTFGQRSTLLLMLGAILFGWIASRFIQLIQGKTKLGSDASIGIVMSFFLAFGLVLLSGLQNNGKIGQSGLSDFLFGKVAALSNNDALLFSIIFVLILIYVVLFQRTLNGYAFNKTYLIVRGVNEKRMELLQSLVVLIVISIGIQAVGVILMSALFIVPVSIARAITYRPIYLLTLAAIFGLVSTLSGTFASIQLPKIPTGPLIIVILVTQLFFVFLIRNSFKYYRENRSKRTMSNPKTV